MIQDPLTLLSCYSAWILSLLTTQFFYTSGLRERNHTHIHTSLAHTYSEKQLQWNEGSQVIQDVKSARRFSPLKIVLSSGGTHVRTSRRPRNTESPNIHFLPATLPFSNFSHSLKSWTGKPVRLIFSVIKWNSCDTWEMKKYLFPIFSPPPPLSS